MGQRGKKSKNKKNHEIRLVIPHTKSIGVLNTEADTACNGSMKNPIAITNFTDHNDYKKIAGGFVKCAVLALLGLMMIPLTTFAQADSGCVAAEVAAFFSAQQSGIKNYKIKIVKKDNFASETFELENGIQVKVTQGGCTHFGKSIMFTLDTAKTKIKSKKKSKTKEKKFSINTWLRRANELLSQLPLPNNIAGALQRELKVQSKSLSRQVPYVDKGRHSVEATDKNGYNTVSLDINEKSKTTDVTIAVSTAL
jgi:hypothetical protein